MLYYVYVHIFITNFLMAVVENTIQYNIKNHNKMLLFFLLVAM